MVVGDNKKFDWSSLWNDVRDRSVITLILWNVIVIIWAVYAKWDGLWILFLYIVQNMIIGFFWFLKILNAQNLYSKNPFNENARPIPAGYLTRLGVGITFLAVFTAANLFYFLYLLLLSGRLPVERFEQIFKGLVTCGMLFFVDQFLVYRKNRDKDEFKWAHIRKVVYYPFIRVVPMHLTLRLIGHALFLQIAKGKAVDITSEQMVLFLTLKAVADVISYIVVKRGFGYEHNYIGLYENTKIQIRLGRSGKEIVLPDGRSMTIRKGDEIEKELDSIEKLPADVRQEVIEGLLAKHANRKPDFQ
jgi:hypothetical protein